MTRLCLCLLILTALVFTTGCPKYKPKVDFENPGSFIGKLNAHLKDAQHQYECYRFGSAHTDLQGKPCTGFTKDDNQAKIVRNELLESTLPYIDSGYVDFITDIQAGRDRTNFIADLIDLGAAAAVGITNGERPLQIIGVALTAFRGGRKSADANFYKDQSTPILISKMDGNRAKVRALILQREAKEVVDYPLGAAIADIVDYYNAGTLVRAFTQLQQDTATSTQASEAQLETLKKEAGIRGVVPAEVLAASNEFSAAIRNLVTAYDAATTNIGNETGTINTKSGDITAAEAAISRADQDIGTANGQIASAPNATARAQAEAAKATAVAAKATAEKNKLQATSDKQAAETAKTEASKARDQALGKLRAIFEAISDDPRLSPLLSKSIEEDRALTESGRARLGAMLERLKQKPTPTTDADKDQAMSDYASILFKFQGTIARTANAEMLKGLRDILNANK